MLPAVLNPVFISGVSATVTALIATGKLVAAELTPLIKSIFRREHSELTEDELNAIAKDVESRAEVREALSKAEAGI